MINLIMQIRNADFVNDCRELTSKGYTQNQIIQKLIPKYQLNSLSRPTIRRALQEGLPQTKRITRTNETIFKQSA